MTERQGARQHVRHPGGSMTCTVEDGTVTELSGGDSMPLTPSGIGEWYAHQPLRKLCCEFKSE